MIVAKLGNAAWTALADFTMTMPVCIWQTNSMQTASVHLVRDHYMVAATATSWVLTATFADCRVCSLSSPC